MILNRLVGASLLLLVVGVSGQQHFRQPAQSLALAPQHHVGALDPNTTPVPILIDSRRIDLKTGAFVYEYAGGDGSAKFEFRFPNGTVIGNYSFVNEQGILETREYTAGGRNPSLVDETTDPNYVDLGNYDHYRHLERPYVHNDAPNFEDQFFRAPQPRLRPQARPQAQARPQPRLQPRLPAHSLPAPPRHVQAHIPAQTVHHVPVQAPPRPRIQVPILPQVTVPINVHAAAHNHFSQPPIIAPTFNLAAVPSAPALHRPRPSPALAPAPIPVQRRPAPAPAPPHRLAPGQGQSTNDFLDSIIRQFQ